MASAVAEDIRDVAATLWSPAARHACRRIAGGSDGFTTAYAACEDRYTADFAKEIYPFLKAISDATDRFEERSDMAKLFVDASKATRLASFEHLAPALRLFQAKKQLDRALDEAGGCRLRLPGDKRKIQVVAGRADASLANDFRHAPEYIAAGAAAHGLRDLTAYSRIWLATCRPAVFVFG